MGRNIKIAITIVVIVIVIIIIIISLYLSGKLSGKLTGVQTDPPEASTTTASTQATTDPPETSTASASAPATSAPATSAPESQWTNVFDSMKTTDKCIFYLDISDQITKTLSVSNTQKILEYMFDQGLMPVDNPFFNNIETNVIGCSGYGSVTTEGSNPIVLTLNLNPFNNTNPFKQGDKLYIYGVNGNTSANSTSKQIVVMETIDQNSKLLKNQIKLAFSDNCSGFMSNYFTCSEPIYGNGDYTGGGIVRIVPNISISNYFTRLMYFSLYLKTINSKIDFNWPYIPMPITDIYQIYKDNYVNYMNWMKTFGTTCISFTPIMGTSIDGYETGPAIAEINGMDYNIVLQLLDFGGTILGIINTNDSKFSKFTSGEKAIIKQNDHNSLITDIDSVLNCEQRLFANYGSSIDTFLSPKRIPLSSSLTQNHLDNIINYVLSLDSSINTVILESGYNLAPQDNYDNSSIYISFINSTPSSMFSTKDIDSNLNKICFCNGTKDVSQIFFPNKNIGCINQIIYSKKNGGGFNFTDYTGSCNNTVELCFFDI
jgi:hypothetical protein